MKRKLFSLLLCLSIVSSSVYSQVLDNIWMFGRDINFTPPWGPLKIDFNSGIPVFDSSYFEMEFASTHANITDSAGNLLFYTNGVYIANALHDTMQNGSGLNPSQYTTSNSDGLHLRQANLIIPKPDDSDIFYLFHSTVDSFTIVHQLYLTTIDISANGGLGKVVTKNQIIINDEINIGKITAVKHGNGRDWWVICHKLNSNEFYKILVTPSGIFSITKQSIGIFRGEDLGQAYFSNDGLKYAYFWYIGDLEIFDFDRCTGMYSNPVFIDLGTSSGEGVAFSPDNSKLYVSATDSLFQFDLNAANIEASQTTVAVWDSFLYTIGSFSVPTWLELMKLAPDGKIYITTGNSTQYMHVINQPDSLGTACDVQQHSLYLPRLYFNTLPNHPNYHLGPLVGSICDTVYTGIPPPEQNLTLKLYPNPNSGAFQITYTPLPENLQLQVHNIFGEEIYKTFLPKWSQIQSVNLPQSSDGIYLLSISSSVAKKSIKFIVSKP